MLKYVVEFNYLASVYAFGLIIINPQHKYSLDDGFIQFLIMLINIVLCYNSDSFSSSLKRPIYWWILTVTNISLVALMIYKITGFQYLL